MGNIPNILFIIADDQRYDTINALGNSDIYTPNLDMLVKQGTTFTQAHIPSGTSGAVCMPSRAMLHTGRNLFGLEKEGEIIPNNHALLGETLKNAGFNTFGTGKWHNGTESYARSFNCGDEIFFGGMDDHWNVPAYCYDPTGKYKKRTYKVKNYMHESTKEIFISDHVAAGKHSTELFSDAIIKFLNEYNLNKPFFAYLSFMAPHDPRSMPDKYKKIYDSKDIDVPKNFMSYHPIEYNNTKCRDEMLAPYPRTVSNTIEQIKDYYAMISHIDYEIGRIIKSLKDNGQLDNTIIIYTADNGLALGQHGLFGKQNHYEHSIRVPFIIKGPGIPKNEKRDTFIYLMDIFPTLCEMLNIDIPNTVQGKSFYKCIYNNEYEIRENLYFAYTDKIRSVKTKQYKLMEHVYDGRLTTQLFDMKNDPWELANIAEYPNSKEIIKHLRKLMESYCKSWNELLHPLGKSYWENYNKCLK